ncbi:glycosyltransferase family 4 protein [Salegentibacter sp. BDJ18]|nr:glycosyltransferase family 4 protein [Salegentibacter sp. BDJ18]
MDRFFKAYNEALLKKGEDVNWFFSGGIAFDFYEDFNLFLAKEETVEALFLEVIDKEQFDVAITHFVSLCTPFYKKIKKKGVGHVIAVDHNPRPLNGFSFEKRIRKKIEGKLYSKYINCFVGVSKYTVDAILNDYGRHLKNKTKLVYNGIDTSSYKQRKEENFGKMVVASHLRESKGLQDLIEAVYLLSKHHKELIEIDVFGEGPYENILKKQVEKYKLQQQIRFKGSTPHLSNLFQNYSYMLQPTYMECFSLSILESLAANVPVVTTTVGGNTEIIQDKINGFLFYPKHINSLAAILQNILCGSIAIDVNVSRLVRENYNLDEMVKNHINLLPKYNDQKT